MPCVRESKLAAGSWNCNDERERASASTAQASPARVGVESRGSLLAPAASCCPCAKLRPSFAKCMDHLSHKTWIT